MCRKPLRQASIATAPCWWSSWKAAPSFRFPQAPCKGLRGNASRISSISRSVRVGWACTSRRSTQTSIFPRCSRASSEARRGWPNEAARAGRPPVLRRRPPRKPTGAWAAGRGRRTTKRWHEKNPAIAGFFLGWFERRRSHHRQLQPLLLRTLLGDVVARIRVPHHARARVVPEHARNALVGGFRAIAHDHHARVLRVAHADAAAVVQRDPRRATGH